MDADLRNNPYSIYLIPNSIFIPNIVPPNYFMKKAAILLYTCAAILFFTNCHKKLHPAVAKTPAEELDYATTHYTEAQRAQGKILFEKNCAACHDLPVAAENTIPQWDDILPKMFKKAKLSYDDAGLVKAYLIFNAKK